MFEFVYFVACLLFLQSNVRLNLFLLGYSSLFLIVMIR